MSRTWRARAAGARDYVGLSDAKVSIEGKAIRRTADSDGTGRSIFSNLEPGEYKLSVALEGYTQSSEVPPVKLHAKGCAEVMLPVQIDRIVTGKVVTSDGLPATGVEIEALPFRPRNENDHPTPADSSTTEKNGRYVLRNLQEGDYYLGVSLGRAPSKESPYTRWFFPGTEDPAAAVLVHMYDKPGELTFDLTLPDRQKPRVIEGTVVWPDGRPAAEVAIKLEDPRWPWQVSDWKITDAAGRFTAEGFDCTAYRVHAVSRSQNAMSAEPIYIKPGSAPAKVSLVLSQKGDTAFKQNNKGLESWRQGQGLR